MYSGVSASSRHWGRGSGSARVPVKVWADASRRGRTGDACPWPDPRAGECHRPRLRGVRPQGRSDEYPASGSQDRPLFSEQWVARHGAPGTRPTPVRCRVRPRPVPRLHRKLPRPKGPRVVGAPCRHPVSQVVPRCRESVRVAGFPSPPRPSPPRPSPPVTTLDGLDLPGKSKTSVYDTP